jgi:uncharacterized RDD family membrane protein YckC
MPEMTCTFHPGAEGSIVRCARCLRPFCSDCLVRLGGRPYCGDCKLEQIRDAQSGVPAAQFELATLGKRFIALFIDGMIVGAPTMIVFIIVIVYAVVSSGGKSQMPTGLNFIGLVQIPIMIIYEGLMLGRKRGQTFGKMAMNLRVVQPDGSDITRGQAWGRAVVRSLMASLLSLINYLPAFFTNEKTALHDMAAKTRVVSLG